MLIVTASLQALLFIREKCMDMINSSFGSGGMTCCLNMNVLPSFKYLKQQHEVSRLPTKTAIMQPGKSCMYFQ